MKFSTIFAATLASLALAAPTERSNLQAKIVVESKDKSLNGKTLYGKHEGAGIDYVFFAKEGDALTYETDHSLLSLSSDSSYGFGVASNFAVFGVSFDEPATVEGNYVAVEGDTSKWAACKNVNDPYNYSKDEYLLYYLGKDAPKDCVHLKLKVVV